MSRLKKLQNRRSRRSARRGPPPRPKPQRRLDLRKRRRRRPRPQGSCMPKPSEATVEADSSPMVETSDRRGTANRGNASRPRSQLPSPRAAASKKAAEAEVAVAEPAPSDAPPAETADEAAAARETRTQAPDEGGWQRSGAEPRLRPPPKRQLSPKQPCAGAYTGACREQRHDDGRRRTSLAAAGGSGPSARNEGARTATGRALLFMPVQPKKW